MYDQHNKGQCVSCGFLCRQTSDPLAVPRHFEATSHCRQTGVFHDIEFPQTKTTTRVEVGCARGKRDLPSEKAARVNQGETDIKAVLSVITDDRQCPFWVAYVDGLSPEDHLREKQLREMEERTKMFHEDLQKRHQEFTNWLEAESRKNAESREARREKTDAKREHVGWWFALAALLFTAVSLTPDSIAFRWLFGNSGGDHAATPMTQPVPDTEHVPPEPEGASRP